MHLVWKEVYDRVKNQAPWPIYKQISLKEAFLVDHPDIYKFLRKLTAEHSYTEMCRKEIRPSPPSLLKTVMPSN